MVAYTQIKGNSYVVASRFLNYSPISEDILFKLTFTLWEIESLWYVRVLGKYFVFNIMHLLATLLDTLRWIIKSNCLYLPTALIVLFVDIPDTLNYKKSYYSIAYRHFVVLISNIVLIVF